MSTGFTYQVGEEESYSFEEFIWGCARAFGPLGHMRDDSSNAEIKPPEPSTYYHERLQEANKEYARLTTLTLEEASEELDREYEKDQASLKLSLERNKVVRRRFQVMFDKVEAWNPPTPDHIKLKEFMIQQLKLELDSDHDYYSSHIGQPKETPQKWLRDAILYASEDLKRIVKHIEDEKENIRFSTEWIDHLKQSVPFPKKRK